MVWLGEGLGVLLIIKSGSSLLLGTKHLEYKTERMFGLIKERGLEDALWRFER